MWDWILKIVVILTHMWLGRTDENKELEKLLTDPFLEPWKHCFWKCLKIGLENILFGDLAKKQTHKVEKSFGVDWTRQSSSVSSSSSVVSNWAWQRHLSYVIISLLIHMSESDNDYLYSHAWFDIDNTHQYMWVGKNGVRTLF